MLGRARGAATSEGSTQVEDSGNTGDVHANACDVVDGAASDAHMNELHAHGVQSAQPKQVAADCEEDEEAPQMGPANLTAPVDTAPVDILRSQGVGFATVAAGAPAEALQASTGDLLPIGVLGSPLSVHGLGPKPGEISQNDESSKQHAVRAVNAESEIDLQPSMAPRSSTAAMHALHVLHADSTAIESTAPQVQGMHMLPMPRHAPHSPGLLFQSTAAPNTTTPTHSGHAFQVTSSNVCADADASTVPERGMHVLREIAQAEHFVIEPSVAHMHGTGTHS